LSHTLTFDLGTSSTKAALWSDSEVLGVSRAVLHTSYPQPGWAEQEPEDWWRSVAESARQLRRRRRAAFRDVTAICFSATRETFALVDDSGRAHGPGILWSDTRAGREATEVGARWGGAEAVRARTGAYLNGSAVPPKLAWVARHRADDLVAARWMLAPRDLVVARMTGEVVTDPSLASRTGLFGYEEGWLAEARALVGEKLPPVRPSVSVVGGLRADAARELGLKTGIPVVLGAGDRACEVLGTGATVDAPMVSWGTTTSLSVPIGGDVRPGLGIVTRGALGGNVWEAGLSAGGAALAWLGQLTGRSHDDLLAAAGDVPPGADGVVALPWLTGARAPWWRPDAEAAFVGVAAADGPPQLARALIEAVALDVARSVELLTPEARSLHLAGGGARMPLWRAVLAAATGLPLLRRTCDEAGSVGARLIAGAALGHPVDVDVLSPVEERLEPDPRLVSAYQPVRRRSDDIAAALLELPQT
jgi:sugar (pentulose or hexulose) kinase